MIIKFLNWLKGFAFMLVQKGKEAEQIKAGKKWDSVVEELKNRK